MNPSSNLILIGPMGAGKSTVGRKLAARFGLRFIDLDHEIERATGASVNLIFEIEGEPNFRDREAKLLDALPIRARNCWNLPLRAMICTVKRRI